MSDLRIGTALLFLCLPAPAGAQQAASLILFNGTIHTADLTRPRASAMVVAGDRIVFVGDDRGALTLEAEGTLLVDLEGATVIPGMIDAHGHLPNLSSFLRSVDLFETRSSDEMVRRVAARASNVARGEWIEGRGWDQNDWPGMQFPSHHALSRAVPDHPVYLCRVDGHAALVNQRAMELAGIDRDTPDPEGGRILRDPDGEPTGVLIDDAMKLVSTIIPSPSDSERDLGILAALEHLNSWGLTGLHDAGVSTPDIRAYERLAGSGRFTLRSYVMLSQADSVLDRYMPLGPRGSLHGGRLWLRAIKISADGALGSRGAALLDDYSDDPGNTGLITTPADRIMEVAVRALRSGFQLNVHAIGDRANRMVLDVFERALDSVPVADHRFRIEHAQILHHLDIPRFAELGVIPSMQGSHQTSDMYWAVDRIGPTRARGAYAWRQLLDTGVIIPNGSDLPVESANPLISFKAFVSRRDHKGWPAGGWHPEQITTRMEALLSITLWPAQASFMEDDVGSLTPGKYADFVILDRDIMTAPPDEILDTRVMATYLGGERVWAR